MHIAFLTPEYPHAAGTPSGGLGTSIKNLAASLVEHKVRVSIFIYGQCENLHFQEDEINFHFIKQKKYRYLGWYNYRKFIEAYLNDIILRDNIDLIEAPDWTGITAFMNISCPVIVRMHGSDAYFCYLEGRKQKIKNRIFESLALKNADALVSVSDFTAETTKKIFSLKRKIEVIPNSIETHKFLPSCEKQSENMILYFGTLIRKKGILELAEIFNEVIRMKPQSELFIIGKDAIDIFENKSTLVLFKEILTSQAEKRITYIPEVSYDRIKEYIAKAKVIVLPSFAEALPMTWLEAMAMEKALVTSNIGWATEIMINAKTGFIENPKDHSAYAQKIIFLLENTDDAVRMGQEARRRVIKKFSTEVTIKNNYRFYKNAITNRY